MSDTGITLVDAVVSMQTHIDAKKATLGVGYVYAYPAYREGKRGPAISVEVESAGIVDAEFGGPAIIGDWGVGMTIWYWDELKRFDAAYAETLRVLSELMEYLIESPTPDAFGNLLIDRQQFGPAIGLIPNVPADSSPLFGGSLSAVLTVTRTHAIS